MKSEFLRGGKQVGSLCVVFSLSYSLPLFFFYKRPTSSMEVYDMSCYMSPTLRSVAQHVNKHAYCSA